MRLVSNLPRALAAVATVAALAVSANAQTLGCEVGVANGGLIPATGTGGGTFPTTLPTGAGVFTLGVAALPPGATVVTEVRLLGLTHSWLSDVQFVLTDPSGANHNVAVRLGNFSCDFGGDYTFVASCTGGSALPASCTGAAVLAPGTYDQNFGTWPSGTNGILNTRLDTIAAATGTWTLTAYDWAGGDTGAITSFDVCFGNPLPPLPPAGAPTLTSPADLATVANPITLTWNAVACAATYDVDIDGGVTTGVASTSFAAPVLAPGVHTWTVRAVNASGSSAFATTRSFTVPAPPPASVCVSGGAGGLVPAAGTGGTGAAWPGTLPATPYTNTYAVTVPAGSTQVVKVDLTFSTQHTWVGDLFVVLTDPSGGNHNLLHRLGSTGTGAGFSCDLNGAYSLYETAGAAWPTVCPGTTDIPAGNYNQSVGAWPSGTNGIFNTPLSAIPVSSGNWTLTIYDWAGGDSGTLASWQVCFDDNPVAPPVVYCTPGTTTNGCLASLTASANPSISLANACLLSVTNVEGQKQGLLYYGIDNTGYSPTPWGMGSSFRCVKVPYQRTGTQATGGTFAMCDGTLSLDWDAYQAAHPSALGNPWALGSKAYVQAWFRDPPAPKSTSMSDAVELTYQP